MSRENFVSIPIVDILAEIIFETFSDRPDKKLVPPSTITILKFSKFLFVNI